MRTDDTLWSRLGDWLDPWAAGPHRAMGQALRAGASWSGHERDHLFLSEAGAEFLDLSALSGLDSPADGRAAAFLDYDRDGWQDVVVVNANGPQLLLHRNVLGRSLDHGSVTVRLRGGNRQARPSDRWSTRDGVGAMLEAWAAGRVQHLALGAGAGHASQNGAGLVVGLGRATELDRLVVRWPSGVVQQVEGVAAGQLVTVFEDAAESPDGSGFVVTPRPAVAVAATALATEREPARLVLHGAPRDAALVLHTSLATWCAACAREAPDLRRLQEAFAPDELAVVGVPVDPDDSAADLATWAARHDVTHPILVDRTAEEVLAFEAIVRDRLKHDGLPASILTDAAGEVLHVQWGPPSRSTVRRLLDGLAP